MYRDGTPGRILGPLRAGVGRVDETDIEVVARMGNDCCVLQSPYENGIGALVHVRKTVGLRKLATIAEGRTDNPGAVVPRVGVFPGTIGGRIVKVKTHQTAKRIRGLGEQGFDLIR